jgi:hypothetical protein
MAIDPTASFSGAISPSADLKPKTQNLQPVTLQLTTALSDNYEYAGLARLSLGNG